MAIVRDRVVITCVVFNYGEFIGLKLYNIDRDLFQDVFKDSLYLFNIWGLSKEAKNYLYQNKRLKNIPIFQSNELKITDGFRCCPDFIGYKDLSEIDIGTGDFVNLMSNVIAYTYKDKDIKSCCMINYRESKKILAPLKRLVFQREQGLKISNITDDKTKIVPLNESFISKTIFVNPIRGKGEDDLVLFEKELTFKAREITNEHKRKLGLLLFDSVSDVRKQKDFEERDFIRRRYLNCSNDFYKVLSKNGLQNIFNGKQHLHQISYFIDTERLLDEFDKLSVSPCGDISCTDIIKGIKKKTDLYGSYSARQKEVAQMLKSQINKIFTEEQCLDCYTMLNIYGLSKLTEEENLAGFSHNNLNVRESVFVDITKNNIFSLETLYILIHEYIHYLSKDVLSRKSGIVDYNNKYSNAYKILNEGLTELLTCYFLSNELRVTNKNSIDLVYNGKKIKVSDYQSLINPYLKTLDSFYPDVEFVIENMGKKDKRLSKTYQYNLYIICQIMRDIGINKVIKYYFEHNFDAFEYDCIKYYGRSVWDFVITELNEQKLNITDINLYKKILEILKGGN